MEFYPDDRYRHDNKHNKCNSNLECMRLEDLLVCPKCHCVVLMKPEKREYVYCHKCHGNTLMVPLVYVISICQNYMNFPVTCMPMPYPPNMAPFMTLPPMLPQGGPGPLVIQPANNSQAVSNQSMSNVNYGPWQMGYPVSGIGPEMYPFPPMVNSNTIPFTPLSNIDQKQTNNGYNNAYIPNNYMNPFWGNSVSVNPNNYNNPNTSNSNKDPNKDNKIKTPIITKRASELFD